MKNPEEQWALITGATSGIGAAYARQLASRGISLILAGRRKEVLGALAERLESLHGITVELVIGDLSDPSAVDAVIEAGNKRKPLRYLINNAGYGSESPFFDDGWEQQEPMLRVHIDAAARITHALAPCVSVPGGSKGGIIFVSSLASFVSSPSSVLYCSTKAFLNSFAASVAVSLYPRRIPVQALCPGFTRTDFHDKLHIPRSRLKNRFIIRWMKADTVAAISLKKLKMNRIIVVPGFLNNLVRVLAAAVPAWIYLPLASRTKKLFLAQEDRK
ncbi:MAG: SDR family NAD(P)-dependent oxidoreductase [Spirochaetales bacterium]|nr:SDR family NAD(P)-dependent oxidoreductase [Spirochaetales bacterium]